MQDLKTHRLVPDETSYLRPARDPDTTNWHLGLEWPEPRDVAQVVVQFAGTVPPDLHVQYWRKNWPTPAPERWTGARRGWIGRDDPWHGEWTTVRAERVIAGGTCTFTFDPIDLAEIPNAEQLDAAEHYLARFRRTLKIRLVHGGSDPSIVTGLAVHSGARWMQREVEVLFGVGQLTDADWSGEATAANGYVQVAQLENASKAPRGTRGWNLGPGSKRASIHLKVVYALARADAQDPTVVTLNTKARSFSFQVTDLDQGPIFIRDYGAFLHWANDGTTLDAFLASLATAPTAIYDRVNSEPEHSLERAIAEIPPLDVTKQESGGGLGFYMPLSVEAGKQEWALRYNGELFADKRHLKLAGRDAAELLWPSHRIRMRFGSGDPPDFHEQRGAVKQSLREGWLPIVTSAWHDREIAYEQTTFATLLDGPMSGQDARRGDEDVTAMLRFTLRNTTHGTKRAQLWLVIDPQEQLTIEGSTVLALGRVVPAESVARQWKVAPYECAYLRAVIDTRGQGVLSALPSCAGEAGASQAVPTAILYSVDLKGGESHSITLTAPFVTLTEPDAWLRAAALDFDAKLEETAAWWKSYVESAGQIEVPDQVLNDFHKAARTHVAITADKDPVSGLIAIPAATYLYGVCANEACWQIAMLDQAGHHDRADAYLETFLATQGMSTLDGDFSSSEGVMQGLDLDDGMPHRSHFAYNLDPGFIMETLVEHYRLTQDRAWLHRITPKLIAACDFVIRERERTKVTAPDGSPVPEWGLLPAGHLEDNPEWRNWFAVNAHAHKGLAGIAAILAEIEQPEAARLAEAAAAYRQDIRHAAHRAMVGAPVVRLLDGTYVPHVPTRTGTRQREWGWFREAAYGALHLLEGDVFEPREEEMTWVLKDLEDNLFVSREWGRPVDLETSWVSHGGITIQPNLQDLAIDYLRRGQVKHALRALFNNFGASLYVDVRTFTEHPVVELGHGVGPFYKSDEAKALVWLRAMLLREEGRTLHIALGAPRAWFAAGKRFGVQRMASAFGPITYSIESDGASIKLSLDMPGGRAPDQVVIHLRHPGQRAIAGVRLEGVAVSDASIEAETLTIKTPPSHLVASVSFS